MYLWMRDPIARYRSTATFGPSKRGCKRMKTMRISSQLIITLGIQLQRNEGAINESLTRENMRFLRLSRILGG